MVRVISQGFNSPRSRHSSGEDMIDRFAAMKALSASHDDEKHQLKDIYAGKPLVIDCNTDTNDSFSGLESEEDSRTGCVAKDLQNNNAVSQDLSVMKRERRRERNKLSAQSYRQRRRQQNSAAQKTLESLETQNKALLEKVRQLEAEKHIVEDYLRSCVRVPWCPQQQTTSCAATNTEAATNCNSSCNINNNNCDTNIATTSTQGTSCTHSCSSPGCSASSLPTPSSSAKPLVSPGSASALQYRFTGNMNEPGNYLYHQADFGAEPLNMVVEKNNNMPLRMPGVAMTSDGSSVS